MTATFTRDGNDFSRSLHYVILPSDQTDPIALRQKSIQRASWSSSRKSMESMKSNVQQELSSVLSSPLYVRNQTSLSSMNRLDGHVLRRRKRNLLLSSFSGDTYSSRPSSQRPKTSKWLIPSDHPYKILWDLMTIIVSLIGAYNAHSNIRDRSFTLNPWFVFCECWYFLDIILNFMTQHKSFNGKVLRDGTSVWARYLTTWFVVDLLSLLPWEMIYLQPAIDIQNRLSWFSKVVRRSKAVVRVTRVLRGRHLKLFGWVARHTRQHAGVNARRLLQLLIKYVPKYWFVWRRMRGIVFVRMLRMVHILQRLWKTTIVVKAVSLEKKRHDDDIDDDDTVIMQEEWEDMQEEEEEDDNWDDLY